MFLKRARAASGTEAGMLVGLIAVALIGVIGATGERLNEIFSSSGNMLGLASEGNGVSATPPAEPESLPASCLQAFQNGETETGLYQIDLTGGDEDDAFEVYCDMTRKGGGWTLVGVMADDGNDYWTWNNRVVTYDGVSTTGSLSNLSADFQSQAWHDLPGNEVLFTKAGNISDFLYYPTILSGGTLGDKYPNGTNTIVGEFNASDVSGTWWQETACSTDYTMSLTHPDSDQHGWSEGSWGFVWRSSNNEGCNYDDTFGGLSSATQPTVERMWGIYGFYRYNFEGSALQVWVR